MRLCYVCGEPLETEEDHANDAHFDCAERMYYEQELLDEEYDEEQRMLEQLQYESEYARNRDWL